MSVKGFGAGWLYWGLANLRVHGYEADYEGMCPQFSFYHNFELLALHINSEFYLFCDPCVHTPLAMANEEEE